MFQKIFHCVLLFGYVMGSGSDDHGLDDWCRLPDKPLQAVAAYHVEPSTGSLWLKTKYIPAIDVSEKHLVRARTALLFVAPLVTRHSMGTSNSTGEWE